MSRCNIVIVNHSSDFDVTFVKVAGSDWEHKNGGTDNLSIKAGQSVRVEGLDMPHGHSDQWGWLYFTVHPAANKSHEAGTYIDKFAVFLRLANHHDMVKCGMTKVYGNIDNTPYAGANDPLPNQFGFVRYVQDQNGGGWKLECFLSNDVLLE